MERQNNMGKQVAVLRPREPTKYKLVHILEAEHYFEQGWVGAIKFYQTQAEKWQDMLDTATAAEEFGNVYPILDDSLGE